MAGHAQLKFVMTECSKTQIRLTGLNSKSESFLIMKELQVIPEEKYPSTGVQVVNTLDNVLQNLFGVSLKEFVSSAL